MDSEEYCCDDDRRNTFSFRVYTMNHDGASLGIEWLLTSAMWGVIFSHTDAIRFSDRLHSLTAAMFKGFFFGSGQIERSNLSEYEAGGFEFFLFFYFVLFFDYFILFFDCFVFYFILLFDSLEIYVW